MPGQLTYADPGWREGQVADPADIEYYSYLCEGAIKAGLLVEFASTAGLVQALSALPAADVDAIATAAQFKSNTSGTSYTTATELNGAIGIDRISPARSVTVTFAAASINDWDTALGETLVEIYGLDASGNPIKDSVARPNGATTATYTTALAFSAVTRIDVPASNGAGGTGTVGVSNSAVELGLSDYAGIALFDPMKEPNTTTAEYADQDQINVTPRGRVRCVTEHAVSAGDDVYVRVIAAGADVRGQFTGQDGSGDSNYAKLSGARWRSAAVADATAILEIG